MNNQKAKHFYVLLFIFFFITYAYFFQGGGWNQNGRICLTRSIIHQHDFTIDEYREDSQEPYFEFVNTGDWSYYQGHYYSNKSPGLSFMAVVPFAITEYCLKYIFPSDTEKQVLYSVYVSTLCTVGICGVFLCLLLFHVFIFFFKFEITPALLLTLFFGFGTLVFSYSTTFYSHIPAAFFSYFSFVLALHIKHDDLRNKKVLALGSGFSAAAAVLIEPSAVVLLLCIFLYFISFKEGRKRALLFLVGCIPLGLLQCFYNAVCFSGPFNASYDYANDLVMHRVNGRLFGLPRLRNIFELLFPPYRGLFFSSPVYLMALPGIVLFFKQRKWLAEGIFCSLVSIFFLLYISCFFAWYGGSAPGPRYLLPAFPFGFMLTIHALRKFPKIFKTIGLLSILINLSITLVGNEIPGEIKYPLTDVVLKNILEGKVSINPVPFSNFANYPDIYQLARIETWMPNFNSFNLGEVLFPHHIASILPLLGFWVIGACLLRWYLKKSGELT